MAALVTAIVAIVYQGWSGHRLQRRLEDAHRKLNQVQEVVGDET